MIMITCTGKYLTRAMGFGITVAVLFTGLLATGKVHGQDKGAGQAMPLFRSDEILELTLEADLRAVFAETDDSTLFPARLTLTDNDGELITVDIELRARGKTRREKDVCTFAPLRLEFPGKELKNTPFEGQTALKLVTHCNKPEFNEQNTIVEYLIYRTYNLFTDSSFLVRPAMINYVSRDKEADTLRRFAFFIEREKYLARRLNAIEIEEQKLHPNRALPVQTCILDMFQYMIGNTDYSIYELHNIILVVDSARTRPPVAVPYDFDWCGLVSARYAEPHPMFNIDEVTERVYRGFKKDMSIVNHSVEIFKRMKPEIYELFRAYPLLEDNREKKALDYLDGFYWVLENDRRIQTEFYDRARIVHD